MDLREVAQTDQLIRGFRKLLLTIGGIGLIALAMLLYVDGPVEYRTATRTVVEPTIRDEIGAMTAREFESIRIGTHIDALEAQFGRPEGNVDDNGVEFYPAVGGGTYFLEYKKNDQHDGLLVTGKYYEHE
jgi:hypothetical protein